MHRCKRCDVVFWILCFCLGMQLFWLQGHCADPISVASAEDMADALAGRAAQMMVPTDRMDTLFTETFAQRPDLGFYYDGFEAVGYSDTTLITMHYHTSDSQAVLPVYSKQEFANAFVSAAIYAQTELYLVLVGAADSVKWDYAQIMDEALTDSVMARTMLSQRKWRVWQNAYSNDVYMILQLEYYGSDSAAAWQKKQRIEQEAVLLAQSIFPKDAADVCKVLLAHDALIHRCAYNDTHFTAGENHSAYGVLINGYSVCEGYAEAFQLLMDIAGIEGYIVIGEADNGSDVVSHAWNIVKLDGEYYHIDCTWDDPISGNGSQLLLHDYFLLKDAEIRSTHTWDTARYPSATGSRWDFASAQQKLSSVSSSGAAFSVQYDSLCTGLKRQSYLYQLEQLRMTQTISSHSGSAGHNIGASNSITSEYVSSMESSEPYGDTVSDFTDNGNSASANQASFAFLIWCIVIIVLVGVLYAKFLA